MQQHQSQTDPVEYRTEDSENHGGIGMSLPAKTRVILCLAEDAPGHESGQGAEDETETGKYAEQAKLVGAENLAVALFGKGRNR